MGVDTDHHIQYANNGDRHDPKALLWGLFLSYANQGGEYILVTGIQVPKPTGRISC